MRDAVRDMSCLSGEASNRQPAARNTGRGPRGSCPCGCVLQRVRQYLTSRVRCPQVVEECIERLTEDQIDELCSLVESVVPKPPIEEEAGEGDEAVDGDTAVGVDAIGAAGPLA